MYVSWFYIIHSFRFTLYWYLLRWTSWTFIRFNIQNECYVNSVTVSSKEKLNRSVSVWVEANLQTWLLPLGVWQGPGSDGAELWGSLCMWGRGFRIRGRGHTGLGTDITVGVLGRWARLLLARRKSGRSWRESTKKGDKKKQREKKPKPIRQEKEEQKYRPNK